VAVVQTTNAIAPLSVMDMDQHRQHRREQQQQQQQHPALIIESMLRARNASLSH
jgi:hypothetical protein